MQQRARLHRLDILALIGFIIFMALLLRLFFLQVYSGNFYGEMAEGNRLRIFPINAPRGNMFDRNGILLVTNKPGYTISILPYAKTVTPEEIARLSTLTGTPISTINRRIKEKKDTFELATIKNNASPEVIAKIRENQQDYPGVIIDVQPTRNYLFNTLAAHAVGYVSEISEDELKEYKKDGYTANDTIGKSGLERYYDKELKGTNGGKQVEVDVSGKPVNTLNEKKSVPGDNLVLTIDSRIQQAAEAAVDKQLAQLGTKAAAIVVMNPRNGEILAMVSRPVFNPNLFADGISEKDWNIYNNNPFRTMENKPISGEYPPGSTFKIITGVAALELKKIGPDEKIFDSGRHWLIPKTNANHEAYGWISFQEALAKSDNVYFFELGNRLGIDNIETYARKFGMGELTKIDLPGESEGLVASQSYKKKRFNEDWYLGETFDAAIGQGYNLATPLQNAEVMAQIANGGTRYKPFLVKRIIDNNGLTIKENSPQILSRIEITPSVLQLVRAGLVDACRRGGTAGDTFRNFPVVVAGKTGTAENSHGRDHAWFVAYAPFDNPQLVVSVLVEQGGYGAEIAAPIAREIIAAAFNFGQQQSTTGASSTRYFGEVF